MISEQLGGHPVHPLVGALRREDRGDQELVRGFVAECRLRGGIGFFEFLQDRSDRAGALATPVA